MNTALALAAAAVVRSYIADSVAVDQSPTLEGLLAVESQGDWSDVAADWSDVAVALTEAFEAEQA